MGEINLALVIRGDKYTCFYMEEGLEEVPLYEDVVREVEWDTFDADEDIDEFFENTLEDIKNRIPRFWQDLKGEYQVHWLFSLETGDYYPGFSLENWIEEAEELGIVVRKAENISKDDSDRNAQLLPSIARELLQFGLDKYPVEGGRKILKELPPAEQVRLFEESFADIITTPSWGEKSELRLICEDTYRFMMITMARVAEDKAEEIFETTVRRWQKTDYNLSDTLIEQAEDEVDRWMREELPDLIIEKLDYHIHWETDQIQNMFRYQPYLPEGEKISIYRDRVDGPLLAAVLETYVPFSDRRICEANRLIWKHLLWVFREFRRYTGWNEQKWKMIGNPTYRPGLIQDLFEHTVSQEWALSWVDQMYDAVLEELRREEERIRKKILAG